MIRIVGPFSLPNHPERQFGASDIHRADLLGKEVHIVETVVIRWTLSIPLHRGKNQFRTSKSSP